MRIGIIGAGTVGLATHNSLPENHSVVYRDPPKGYNNDMNDRDAVFICVPTPTKKGKQEPKILLEVLEYLNFIKFNGLIIIKSTVTPKNIQNIMNCYCHMNIMVSPEFLDQNKPYFKQKKHLMGVKDIHQAKMYRQIFHEDTDFRTTNIKTAMMAKYVHNVYGSVKVGFFNEMFEVCGEENIDYREMIGAMLGMTDHISRCYTRMSVDGERGWGGMCFPKDTTAFNNDYPNRITEGVIKENLKYREKEMDNVLK